MKELAKFIVKAKKNTYASQGEIGEKKLNDGSRELVYKEGKLLYRDRYFGFNPFCGEEVVFEDNKIVWMMNYYGKIISNIISEEKIYKFLKKALSNLSEEKPFRGPLNFKEDNFEYINNISGNLKSFAGKEKIFYNGKQIYFLRYHGGFVKNEKQIKQKRNSGKN